MASSARVEEFIRLFTLHESRLRSYVLSMVPRWTDAEEVMQDANLILWQKFDTFTSGGNFFAWACQVARFKVMEFRRARGRQKVIFSDDLVDLLADEGVRVANQFSDRQVALESCLSKLRDDQRKLLFLRYEQGNTVEEIAGQLTRSVEAVAKSLTRLRNLLHDCITRALRVAE